MEKRTHVPGEKPEKTQEQKQKSSRARLISENQRKCADPEALHQYGRERLNHEVWKATLASFTCYRELELAVQEDPTRSNVSNNKRNKHSIHTKLQEFPPSIPGNHTKRHGK